VYVSLCINYSIYVLTYRCRLFYINVIDSYKTSSHYEMVCRPSLVTKTRFIQIMVTNVGTISETHDSHVRMIHMYAWFTCTYDSHVRMIHMYAWFTCTHDSHVRMIHMYAWFTCTHDSHVRMIHMYAWFTYTYKSWTHHMYI